MDSDYYDLQYEAWRHGHNPDDIHPGRYDEIESRGFEPCLDDFYNDYPKEDEE